MNESAVMTFRNSLDNRVAMSQRLFCLYHPRFKHHRFQPSISLHLRPNIPHVVTE
jgi:hypothetical protein